MLFSIIIPTYNNANVLEKCFEHLLKQDFSEDFEIIVVNDGSTDYTHQVIEKWKKRFLEFKNIIFKPIRQENKRQAAARNRGVKEAAGDVVIFIGADILVSPHWLKAHKEFHKKFAEEQAIGVGFMTWTPELAHDCFRRWLEVSGIMFSFKGLKNHERTDFWHFYTGNISIKKSFFERYYFDEDMLLYGFEDVVLGYRMIKDGAQVYYLKGATTWHDHPLTEADLFPHRMREIGKSAFFFSKKFPEIPLLPQGFKKFIFKILSLSPVIFLLKSLKREWEWYALSKKYFLEGVEEMSNGK